MAFSLGTVGRPAAARAAIEAVRRNIGGELPIIAKLTPDVTSIVITPIAPHNLNARPLVIPDTTEIRLKVSGREEFYLVSLDSRIASVKNESILIIKKNPYKINMVEIPEETFLKTLRNKLLWGEDKRN